MSELVRFILPSTGDLQAVEDDLALAIFATECLYGRPQTRLELRYELDVDGGRCLAEVCGPAGEAAVRVFLGLLAARCGEGGFSVDRVRGATVAATS